MPDTQYEPIAFSDLQGWESDDLRAAFATFRASCRAVPRPAHLIPPPKRPRRAARPARPHLAASLREALREPCEAARHAHPQSLHEARQFFEARFRPVHIARIGEQDGFLTGYYEPIVDGSRTRTDDFTVPVYRRPSNLYVAGQRAWNVAVPSRGAKIVRKIGRRKFVPYYDRGEIEDGALAGRGLEIVWLRSATDLLFIQIQGSARIRLADGSFVRINYDAHNGHPYTPVGRVLADRGLVPREQATMQRIRQWMRENPDGAAELRRANKSYVFFREVKLSDAAEPAGAQGISLTPARSIAVDNKLHVYGMPFFIEAQLPIDTDLSDTPFRRLVVAQDTGSAIIGPARADIYFGAGDGAAEVSGRTRNPGRFAMLIPLEADPQRAAALAPLPAPRPSEEAIAAASQPKPKAKSVSKSANKPAHKSRRWHRRGR